MKITIKINVDITQIITHILFIHIILNSTTTKRHVMMLQFLFILKRIRTHKLMVLATRQPYIYAYHTASLFIFLRLKYNAFIVAIRLHVSCQGITVQVIFIHTITNHLHSFSCNLTHLIANIGVFYCQVDAFLQHDCTIYKLLQHFEMKRQTKKKRNIE